MNIIPKETGKAFVRNLNEDSDFTLAECKAVVELLNSNEESFIGYFQKVHEYIQQKFNAEFESDDSSSELDRVNDDGPYEFGAYDNCNELFCEIVTDTDYTEIAEMGEDDAMSVVAFLEDNDVDAQKFFGGCANFIYWCTSCTGYEFPGIGAIDIEY